MKKIDLDDGVKHNYEIFEDVLAKIKWYAYIYSKYKLKKEETFKKFQIAILHYVSSEGEAVQLHLDVS